MVADFGLSDYIKVLEDGTSPICGTPGYMAPEVCMCIIFKILYNDDKS